MTLESWLEQATRRLAKESAAQVRAEIADHYESAREAAIAKGADPSTADRIALESLGDPKAANLQYRRVLLTAREARELRHGAWEASFICSRSWLKFLLIVIALSAYFAAARMFIMGWNKIGFVLLAVGTGTVFSFLLPFLPVYTEPRARVFRVVRWTLQVLLMLVAFAPWGLRASGLLIICLAPMIATEWIRHSIRAKLPVERWPKQLYI